MFLTAFAICILTLATLGPLWPLPVTLVNTGLETHTHTYTLIYIVYVYINKRYNAITFRESG